MYFNTKNGAVFEPKNPMLAGLYKLLEKHEPSLSGSRVFDDLVEVYETLDNDLKEEAVCQNN